MNTVGSYSDLLLRSITDIIDTLKPRNPWNPLPTVWYIQHNEDILHLHLGHLADAFIQSDLQ